MSDPRSPTPAPASRNRQRGSGGVRSEASQGPSLFSRDPAERSAWLAQQDEALRYFIPPELRPIADFAAEMGPVQAHRRAEAAARGLLAPGATPSERLMSGADLALETTGIVAAPAVLGSFLRRPASEVSQELLMGLSVNPAAREAAEALAPPPQQINLAGDVPETEGIASLAFRRGDFDDRLSEQELRASLLDLMDNQVSWDVFGDEAEAALIRPRFEALRQRFTDVQPTSFEQEPFRDPTIEDLLPADPPQVLPDIDWDIDTPMRIDGVFPPRLPDTAPAARFPQAAPYAGMGAGFQNPQSWLDQGLAGLYSRAARAGDQLRQPRYSDLGQLEAELAARGAPPAEVAVLRDRLGAALESGPLPREQVQALLRDAPGLRVQRTEQYADYGPTGGRNHTSSVYYPPTNIPGPGAATRHFDRQGDTPPLFHSRAAQYDLLTPDGGTAHHVLEIQSDWAQHRQLLPRDAAQRAEMETELQDLLAGPADGDAFLRIQRLEGALATGRTRAEFDEAYPAPYIRNENDWVDAGVRQNLLDAVNSGSDWITFGNGTQAAAHVGMPEDAARRFYDGRVPSRVESVLGRLARDNQIDAKAPPNWWPRLEDVPFVDGETVRGLRLTPEFRELLSRSGLPSFRDGGMVGGLAPLARAETIEPRTPTMRDRARVGLASLVGPELAGRIAGSRENMGLADLTPLGVPMAVEEGTRAAVRGSRAGDIPTALAGAGEALLAITPLPGPARAIARAPAGGGRGGGGRDPNAYQFERVWDPARGREVTRITPRGAPATPATPPPRAAPEAGMEERLRAAESALPTEFPRVRLPVAGGAPLPPTPAGAAFSPAAGQAYRLPQTGGPGRSVNANDIAGDPAHEWVQVPVSALERVGMRSQNLTDPASRLSPDGATAFLAPGDVPRFLTAWGQGAELMGRPTQPILLPPRALPSADVLRYPRAAQPARSFEDMRREARDAAPRSLGAGPTRSRWFGSEEP